MSKPFLRNSLILLLCLLALELVLRLIGFGNIPVYYVSTKYEYALKPNQEMTRFGNYIYINSAGMRSDELRPNAAKILKFGDSVLNGGVITDQSELTSTLLEKFLNTDGADYQVLNVSAGSWGPDNAYRWMQEHGDYNAKAMILLFSSHDWQDQMEFVNVVGNTPYYPAKKPMLAITDAIYWSYSRVFKAVDWDSLGKIQGGKPIKNDHAMGWDNFVNYTDSLNIPLIVYHHADRSENEKGAYNKMGQELDQFLKDKNVTVVSGLNSGLVDNDYRDGIHPEPSGLKKIEKTIEPVVLKQLKE